MLTGAVRGGRNLILDDVQVLHLCLGGARPRQGLRGRPGQSLRLGRRSGVGPGGGPGQRLRLRWRTGLMGGLHLGEVRGLELGALPHGRMR